MLMRVSLQKIIAGGWESLEGTHLTHQNELVKKKYLDKKYFFFTSFKLQLFFLTVFLRHLFVNC